MTNAKSSQNHSITMTDMWQYSNQGDVWQSAAY